MVALVSPGRRFKTREIVYKLYNLIHFIFFAIHAVLRFICECFPSFLARRYNHCYASHFNANLQKSLRLLPKIGPLIGTLSTTLLKSGAVCLDRHV